MATATAPNDNATFPLWPTYPGPVEREINRELDYTESVAALQAARDALAGRR